MAQADCIYSQLGPSHVVFHMLRGQRRGTASARGASAPLPSRSHQSCAVYNADHFLASDDIIATVLRCSSKSTHPAPLQPQSILHASLQK